MWDLCCSVTSGASQRGADSLEGAASHREPGTVAREVEASVSRLERALLDDGADLASGEFRMTAASFFPSTASSACQPSCEPQKQGPGRKTSSPWSWPPAEERAWWRVYEAEAAARAAGRRAWLAGSSPQTKKTVIIRALCDLLDLARRQFDAVHALTGVFDADATWVTKAARRAKALLRDLVKGELDMTDVGGPDFTSPETRAAITDALTRLYEIVSVCALVTSAAGKPAAFVRGPVFRETLASARGEVQAALDAARAESAPTREQSLFRRGATARRHSSSRAASGVETTTENAVRDATSLSEEAKALALGAARRQNKSLEPLGAVVRRAVEFLAAGDWDGARRALCDAPHNARDAVECCLVRGACHYEERQYRAALAQMQAAVDRDPNDADAWFGLAICLENVASTSDKEEEEEEEEDTGNKEAHEELGVAYERCLALDPFHWRAHNKYGSLLQRRGALDAAEREYQLAIALADWKVASTPRNNYATLLMNERDEYDLAEAQYKLCLEASPESPLFLNNYALLLLNARDDADAAEELLKEALRIAPSHALSRNSYGLLLKTKRREYARAEEEYRAAMASDPTYAAPVYNLGVLHHEIFEQFDSAEQLYRRAVALDSTYAAARNNLGRLLEHCRGDIDAAEREYRAAIDIDPRDPVAKNNLASLLVEEQRRECSDDDEEAAAFEEEAERLYKQALELDAHYAAARNNLAALLAKREDYRGAEEQYRLALSDDPTSVTANCNYGLLLRVVKNDDDSALRHFRAAASESADRSSPAPFRYIGDALLASNKGDVDAALKNYAAALEIDPDYVPARLALADVYRNVKRENAEAERHFVAAVRSATAAVKRHQRQTFSRQRGDDDGDHHLTKTERETETETRPRRKRRARRRPTDSYWVAAALSGYADFLFDLERYDEALDHLRRALDVRPDYAPAHWRMAAIFEARVAYDEAAAHVRAFLAATSSKNDDHCGLHLPTFLPRLPGGENVPTGKPRLTTTEADVGTRSSTASREDAERKLAHLERLSRQAATTV